MARTTAFLAVLALLAAIVMGVAACGAERPPAPAAPVDPGAVEFGVRERIGIDTREDTYFYNGADLYFYSDDHSTQTAKIDGGTGAIKSGSYTASWSDAVTVTGVLTNVRILYYQVP